MAASLRHHLTLARWIIVVFGMVLLLTLGRFSLVANEHVPILGQAI